ncbi:MAG: DUF1566 domain-containing protein [Deltaproteobacteria bacterium]|nr:DUF1566 domain-containing protein [Deltaproteobacteria bacterium]
MSVRATTAVAVAVALLHAEASIAKAPPGRYTLDADTAQDIVTGLRWQRATPAGKLDAAGAKAYCQGLSLGGYSTGWRLPNLRELVSLVDRRATIPAIDATAFPGTKSDMYWSATPHAAKQGLMWGLAFNHGDSYFQQPDYPAWVRCVR